jgi:hypothetical protein
MPSLREEENKNKRFRVPTDDDEDSKSVGMGVLHFYCLEIESQRQAAKPTDR